MPDPVLRFPNQAAIVAYLQQHPLTNRSEVTDLKITNFVAALFSNKACAASQVATVVTRLMHEVVAKKNPLSNEMIMTITLDLGNALLDCANRKQF